MLAHPSVKVLGHRNDLPDLMRQSDILVLPSIGEGRAGGGGGDGEWLRAADFGSLHGRFAKDGENALMHPQGGGRGGADPAHPRKLHEARAFLEKLRQACIAGDTE